MNPFKSLFITLSLLALLAANAAAQCGGKTVYIQLPDGWNKTSVTILWEGNTRAISATTQGAWTVFTFPTNLPNDKASYTFSFSKKATEIDNGNTWIASGARWNWSSNSRPTNEQGIACSVFGSARTIYIIEDLNRKGTTSISTNPPNAKVFYFYPPEDDKWIAGKSYITDNPNSTSSAKLMGVDPNMCGWYRVVYFNDTPPEKVQIWLGQNGVDKIGSNGRQDDFDDGVTVQALGAIELSAKFGSLGDTIYFVADEGYADGWYNNRKKPQTEGGERCKYNLAAFIYDTDMKVHPDFSCGEYSQGTDAGNGPNTNATCTLGGSYSSEGSYTSGGNLKGKCTGVRKGVVQSTLGEGKKIKYNSSGDKWSCWTNEDWFNKAFNPTKGVNVQRCYDMPFTQQANGRYEFDSDKMQNASGRLVGGFFPLVLHNAPNDPDCPSCNAKRPAQNFAPLINSITADRFDQYDAKDGDFSDGDHPTASAFGGDATKSIWNWASPNDGEPTREGMSWYMHGTTAIKGTEMAPANQFFCFESHAEFLYDPEQEFIFRGDDDIWIYINNQLVVDLGGTHLAAPGHIKLKEIKPALVAGDKYPIDIFFCDRRTTMSNVRISTNMYITQKQNFSATASKAKTVMCALIEGNNDCASKMTGTETGAGQLCGPDLVKNYDLKFFMVKRGTADTTWLSPTRNRENCSGKADDDFSCYGGINATNGEYRCGDIGQCKGNEAAAKKVNITGSYNVYTRLVPKGAAANDISKRIGKDILIDQFKSETNTRIVWGTLLKGSDGGKSPVDLKDGNGNKAAETQSIIAGKRTPVYISGGAWTDEKYTVFEYEDETPSGTYSISVDGKGLTLYASQTGDELKSSGELPASGIDTLWAEAAFSVGNTTFTLSLGSTTPTMKLNVYQPELRFADKDFKPTDEHRGYSPNVSGYDWGESGKIPYVSMGLPMYLVAWDAKNNKLCDFCNFALDETSSTTISTPASAIWGDGIVQSTATKLEGGKLQLYIHGNAEVGVEDTATATWKVFGPSKDVTVAEWTGLKFKMAPVPMPISSEIFDRNGDGIGDSLRIKFSKSFKIDGAIVDSLLLVLLEVVWAKGDTVRYHHPDYKPSDLRNYDYVRGLYGQSGFFAKNGSYWRPFLSDSLIVIAQPDTKLSSAIQTVGYKDAGGSVVKSFIPFKDEGVFQYSPDGSRTALQDRMPPIVVSAKFVADKNGSCYDNYPPGCRNTLEVTLSEPVFSADNSTPDYIKNPFSYCLGLSQTQDKLNCPLQNIDDNDRYRLDYDNLDWDWELARAKDDRDSSYSATYKPTNARSTNKMTPYSSGDGAEGDNIVEMIYYAYKVGSGTQAPFTRMPQSEDWVKIRPPSGAKGGSDVFFDASGNTANPRERGVLITGTNPSSKKLVKITAIPPNAKPSDPVLGNIFENRDNSPPWFSEDSRIRAKDDLFKPGSIAEILPVPKEYSEPKYIKEYYPMSVGTLFDVSSGLRDEVEKLINAKNGCDGKCYNKNGTALLSKENIAEGITIHASVYYHTNLGDYTAQKDPIVVECKDKIFIRDGAGGDCYTNQYNFYLAWDLRTNDNRFAGAGAYVAISKFYVQIEYQDKDKNTKFLKLNQQEFIEMFGISRGTGMVKNVESTESGFSIFKRR